jgi:hypothetical protein
MSQQKNKLKTSELVILIVLFTGYYSLIAQENSDCKVLQKSIADSYNGECKKGLADGYGKATGLDSYEGEFSKGLPSGKGKYFWSNGDVFEGHFKKGLKEGSGKLKYNRPSADSVLTGFWKNDNYMGLFENPYTILEKTSPVNRIIVRKIGNSPNDILIQGEMEMLREKGVNSRAFNGTGFDNVQFPFTADMEANHANVPFSFKLIIFEPGRWEIVINFD